jgi:peptidoglycan/LPS O-acetylase OafA/YrhL
LTVYNDEVIPRNYITALTGLRFFLALWVVLHHLTGGGMMLEPWALTLPAFLYTLIRDGYLAVSAFFLLSGFVLMQSYGSKEWSHTELMRYLRGRFARVYPVYALSLLVVAPYIWLAKVPNKGSLVANYVFLFQGWTGTLPVSWNTPAWSLSCEMFFYLCFPVAVILLRRLSGVLSVVAALAICFLPALMWTLGVPDAFKPLIHLADFLLGILASRAYDALRSKLDGRGYWFYVPGMAAVVWLMLNPLLIPGVLDLNGFLRPFTAMTLIGLALSGGWLARVLSAEWTVFLGKASYAVYILHIPLLWSYKRWAPYWFPGLSGVWMSLIYVCAVVAISAVVYRFFEEPANQYLRARHPAPRVARLVPVIKGARTTARVWFVALAQGTKITRDYLER